MGREYFLERMLTNRKKAADWFQGYIGYPQTKFAALRVTIHPSIYRYRRQALEFSRKILVRMEHVHLRRFKLRRSPWGDGGVGHDAGPAWYFWPRSGGFSGIGIYLILILETCFVYGLKHFFVSEKGDKTRPPDWWVPPPVIYRFLVCGCHDFAKPISCSWKPNQMQMQTNSFL